MMRVVAYLLVIAALAFAAAWLADRPGDVVITWQGRRIETSVMVLVAVIALLTALATMLWSLLRALLRSPAALASHRRARRGARAYQALSRGLVAVGSGDVRAARRFSEEAGRLAPSEPLALLLAAQSAQLSGDRETAALTFQQMAARDDTRVLGLHGLFVEARRRSDPASALFYAEEAARLAAVPGWAGQAVLEFRCVAGDWSGALERLERNAKAGLIDKAIYQRERAVLLTAQALAAEDMARDRAKALAVEAAKLAPDLVPAAALAGRLLGEGGDIRKAARIIEAAWRANPHPDLADAYAHLRPGTSARERLARVEALAAMAAGQCRGRAGGGAGGAGCARVRHCARGARAVDRGADPARRRADGGARRGRAWRRGPHPRVDDARAQRAPRPGLERGWLRLRPLAAGVADQRTARCLRVEGPAGGPEPCRRGDRGVSPLARASMGRLRLPMLEPKRAGAEASATVRGAAGEREVSAARGRSPCCRKPVEGARRLHARSLTRGDLARCAAPGAAVSLRWQLRRR